MLDNDARADIPESAADVGFFCFANSALACLINFSFFSYSCWACSALWAAVIARWWVKP